MKFEPGAVVQLKSGGPALTVVSVDDAGVHCVWYGESNDEIKSGVVAEIALAALEVEEEDDEDEDD